jgi:hypothetical protein
MSLLSFYILSSFFSLLYLLFSFSFYFSSFLLPSPFSSFLIYFFIQIYAKRTEKKERNNAPLDEKIENVIIEAEKQMKKTKYYTLNTSETMPQNRSKTIVR